MRSWRSRAPKEKVRMHRVASSANHISHADTSTPNSLYTTCQGHLKQISSSCNGVCTKLKCAFKHLHAQPAGLRNHRRLHEVVRRHKRCRRHVILQRRPDAPQVVQRDSLHILTVQFRSCSGC